METVAAPPRGLELFAARHRSAPIRLSGSKTAERRHEALEKLGISSVQDLLQHYPRHHLDRTKLRTIRELKDLFKESSLPDEVTIHARVERIDRPFKTKGGKRVVMIKGRIADETGSIDVTWFNQEWVARALRKGMEAFFYGRLSEFRGKLQMTAPRFELVRTGTEPFNVGRIIPIYRATGEMSSDQIRRLMWDQMNGVGEILDPLPPERRSRLGFMPRGDAVRSIHFPDAKEDVMQARRRLIFDELFTLQLGLVYRKRKLERTVQGISYAAPTQDSLPELFLAALPFDLTDAQKRACSEIAADMSKPYPMHRLLEGEVGSGKTVVALYSCLLAIEGGYQAAFMAPTEVLAEQHHLTIDELMDRAFGSQENRNLFAAISQRPVVRLLTGSTPTADREAILREVASGDVDLLVGTHALIQETVAFAKLGVAVVDEQHRFGVHQRRSLREKGAAGEPDILVMTATPIPRTLAVTIYGDLDLSILDELPKGRRPIQTSIAMGDEGRAKAYELIRREVEQGRQAFIVYALRDESDKLELRSAKAEAKRLAAEVFSDLRVGLVHGDMRSENKEAAMSAFREGRTQVLVATTVVEVGVDVPNATVMLVDDADRFGLAQLHQLRGRIGRGAHESYCVLATDLDLTKTEDPSVSGAEQRLRALVQTRDGFKLSEVDLRLRGQGQLFGPRQSGMPDLKLAGDVLEHQDVIKMAREEAVAVLDDDPELRAYEHSALEREMRDRFPESALDVIHSG
jgi:ATP-dependent DNA helicase RecG